MGGTPGGDGEALLAAATLLDSGVVPGVWVVFTGPVDLATGREGVEPPSAYEALAIALIAERAAPGGNRPRLAIRPGSLRIDGSAGSPADRAELARWSGAIERAIPRVDPGHEPEPSPPHFAPRPARVASPRGRDS